MWKVISWIWQFDCYVVAPPTNSYQYKNAEVPPSVDSILIISSECKVIHTALTCGHCIESPEDDIDDTLGSQDIAGADRCILRWLEK